MRVTHATREFSETLCLPRGEHEERELAHSGTKYRSFGRQVTFSQVGPVLVKETQQLELDGDPFEAIETIKAACEGLVRPSLSVDTYSAAYDDSGSQYARVQLEGWREASAELGDELRARVLAVRYARYESYDQRAREQFERAVAGVGGVTVTGEFARELTKHEQTERAALKALVRARPELRAVTAASAREEDLVAAGLLYRRTYY